MDIRYYFLKDHIANTVKNFGTFYRKISHDMSRKITKQKCKFTEIFFTVNGEVKIEYISTSLNLADAFTKGLAKQQHQFCIVGMGLKPNTM